MEQYIPKSTLVAEIKRRMDENRGKQTLPQYFGMVEEDLNILSLIDTLKVKEVDLEKHLKEDIEDVFFDLNGVAVKGATHYLTVEDVKDIAKHFFELALSVNNPITAADRGTAEEIIINLKRVEKDYRINLTKEIEWLRNQVKESAELQHVDETCKNSGDSLTQEPAINVWHDMSEEKENGRNIIIIDPQNFYGAVLRKGGSQLRNHNNKIMEQYISKSALLAEIERLVNNYDKALDYEAALEDVRDFLDSIEVKKSEEIERDKETCKENGDSLTQEPASNVWHDMSEDAENGRNTIIISPKGFYGAVLRKGGSQLRNHNKKRYVKWAYIDDLQNFSNVERTVKNRNEPVNDGLEKAAVEAFKQIVDSNKNNFLEIFKAGVKWQKEQMMEKAVDGVVTFDYYEGDKAYGCVAHDSFCLEDLELKDMDEVKILILKK